MALLGQSRDSRPSMAPLGHVELTKRQKLLESKNKNKNENEEAKAKTNLKILQFAADLVTFTEEILNGKLNFIYSDTTYICASSNSYF